jgi:hypothetical protein
MMNCSKREERSRSGGFELSTLKVVDFDHFFILVSAIAQSYFCYFISDWKSGQQHFRNVGFEFENSI